VRLDRAGRPWRHRATRPRSAIAFVAAGAGRRGRPVVSMRSSTVMASGR
jgi:hypothetical protein